MQHGRDDLLANRENPVHHKTMIAMRALHRPKRQAAEEHLAPAVIRVQICLVCPTTRTFHRSLPLTVFHAPIVVRPPWKARPPNKCERLPGQSPLEQVAPLSEAAADRRTPFLSRQPHFRGGVPKPQESEYSTASPFVLFELASSQIRLASTGQGRYSPTAFRQALRGLLRSGPANPSFRPRYRGTLPCPPHPLLRLHGNARIGSPRGSCASWQRPAWR